MLKNKINVTAIEAQVIKAAISFANLSKPTRIDAEKIFQGLILNASLDYKIRDIGEHSTYYLSPPTVFMTDIEALHSKVRDWLKGICNGNEAQRDRVSQEASESLRKYYLPQINISFDPYSRRLKTNYYFSSAEGCLALTCALILDRERGLTNRLNQCGAPNCGRFRLDLKGRPRRHCNKKHLLKADAFNAKDRVRKWRERSKEKK